MALILMTVGGTGVEHLAKTTGETCDPKAGGAESAADPDEMSPIDPDLAYVIEAWPSLSQTFKAGILGMVRAGDTEPSC